MLALGWLTRTSDPQVKNRIELLCLSPTSQGVSCKEVNFNQQMWQIFEISDNDK